MSDKGVSRIEKGVSDVLGLAGALVQMARENRVPFEAIHRLTTEDGRSTVQKIVDIAHADWIAATQPVLAEARQLRSGGSSRDVVRLECDMSLSALVVYEQPAFEELERRFRGGVSPEYRGKQVRPIERCKTIPRRSRRLAFQSFRIQSRHASCDQIIAELDFMGLRPTIYEELLGFADELFYMAQTRSNELKGQVIHALGSDVPVNARGAETPCFGWYGSVNDRNDLSTGLAMIRGEWLDHARILAVPKDY